MQLGSVEQATVTITADDAYNLFVNGSQVGSGRSIQQMEQYDITRLLRRGNNVVAVRVNIVAAGPAALAARVFVKPAGGQWLSYSSDRNGELSWIRSRVGRPSPTMTLAGNRRRNLEPWGNGAWDRREDVSPQRLSENQRFRIHREFAVDQILGDEVTGSLVNMAFNEFGHIVAAQEGGPLLLIYDSDKDGVVDKTRDYCDLVENIQGILPLNGDVFVTGNGPDGPGIYRLIDKDRNGALEEAKRIAGFTGDSGEHGAHGLTLGPDGRIYCVLGNQSDTTANSRRAVR